VEHGRHHAANIAMVVQTAAAKPTSKDTTAQPRIVTHILGWLAANRQAPATNKTAPTTCTGHLRLYNLTLYPFPYVSRIIALCHLRFLGTHFGSDAADGEWPV
jgi:hypothetical protein